jgi:hypothetical protein
VLSDRRVEESRNGANAPDPGRPFDHEGLCSDLATEGALTLFFGVLSAVRVDLNDLEVEKFDKEFKGFGHLSIVTLATGEAFKGAN